MVSHYSNAKTDLDAAARVDDERSVRTMYELAPYPDLGADLKSLDLFLDRIRSDLVLRGSVRFLEVGCGTGHILVGVARQNPSWECFGLDLSRASLDVAKKLASKHDAKVTVAQGSYLDSLPFAGSFDVIAAIGTIHHCADPVAAMTNLRSALKSDGYLLLHLYGMRCDQEKFDIKEALSILESNLSNYESRFAFFDALMKHKKSRWFNRLARTSPRDAYAAIRDGWRNFQRRRRGVSWSPSFREGFAKPDAPWIDHFCHPCERAYEVPEVRELVEASGFRVVHMLGQGSERPALIPPAWRTRYASLDEWDKYRLSELLSPAGRSFNMILRAR